MASYPQPKEIFNLQNILSCYCGGGNKVPLNRVNLGGYYSVPVCFRGYYPFGSPMVERGWEAGNTGDYRFGFNGKERDDEVNGIENLYNYGFRIYNPRLGKFLSVDPFMRSYPFYTPYQFAGNTPIWAVDLDGREIDFYYQVKLGEWVGDNVIRPLASSAVLFSSTLTMGTANNFYVMVKEGVHQGGAYRKENNLFENCSWKIDENWNITPSTDKKEMFEATVTILTTAIPVEAIVAKAFEPVFKYVGNNLVLTSKAASKIWAGQTIKISLTKTTTVLGKTDDLGIIKATGQHVSNKANTGGISVLSKDKEWKKIIAENTNDAGNVDWAKSGEEFWENYNKPFIDDAVRRGDIIRLVSDPFDETKLFVTQNGKFILDEAGNKQLSLFGREIEYLKANGYEFISGEAIKK